MSERTLGTAERVTMADAKAELGERIFPDQIDARWLEEVHTIVRMRCAAGVSWWAFLGETQVVTFYARGLVRDETAIWKPSAAEEVLRCHQRLLAHLDEHSPLD